MSYRIVVAPDSFKGTVTSRDAARAIAVGLRRADPSFTTIERPIADGGEGTLRALGDLGAQLHSLTVVGPFGMPVRACWASWNDTAYIEAAQGAGAQHLDMTDLTACLRATSYGVGTLIRAALDAGYEHIVLTTGGTCVTDGGAGMLGGLGMRTKPERVALDGGGALQTLVSVDLSDLDPRIRGARIEVALDVANPLLGRRGSAAVFAPQKGAGEAEVAVLEAGLAHWAKMLPNGEIHAASAGAGASGGIGFAALAAFGASSVSGADLIFSMLRMDSHLNGADAVVVGEGSLDDQSLNGKGVIALADRAAARDIPVVAIAGRVSLDAGELSRHGIVTTYSLSGLAGGVEAACEAPEHWLRQAGARLGRALPGLLCT